MANFSEAKKQQLIKIQQLQELGIRLSVAQEALLASVQEESSEDEEKPSAPKSKQRSLLTRVLSLVGGGSRKKAKTVLTERK